MEKLTLQHLVGYLPYGLKIRTRTNKLTWVHKSYSEKTQTLNYKNIGKFEHGVIYNDIKPILHPLSDLITHSEFTDKYHYSFDKKEGFMVKRRNETYARIDELDYLYKNHFDIYGLIENGLAIDINTIK